MSLNLSLCDFRRPALVSMCALFLCTSNFPNWVTGGFELLAGQAQETPLERTPEEKNPAQVKPEEEAPAKATPADDAAIKEGTDQPRSEIRVIDFARDIKPIFDLKCVECHGPKKASNDFRVDQQDSLMTYVSAGDLESSELWTEYLVTADDEMLMPPRKQDSPLTGIELAAIRTWIEEGAEWSEATPEAEAGEPAPTDSLQPIPASPLAQIPKPFLFRLWDFQGYFHPAAVHFPVALLTMAAIFGLGSLVYRESFEAASFHCLWVGALASVVASLMGWSFAEIQGYGSAWDFDWNKNPETRHRWLGVALSAFAVLVALIAVVARRKRSASLRAIWLGGMLLTAGMVGIVGHQGGELVYGEGVYDKAFEQLLGTPQRIESVASVTSAK